MNEADLTALVDRLVEARDAHLRGKAGPERTADCPSLPRLDRGARTNDWTDAERQHIAGCEYCKRTVAIARRMSSEDPVPPPGSEKAPVVEKQPVPPALPHPDRVPDAGREAGFGPGPIIPPSQPVQQFTARAQPDPRQSPVPSQVRMEKSGAGAGEPSGEALAEARPGGGSWALLGEGDQGTFSLSEQLALRYYGDVKINKLRLWLHAVRDEAGQLRPQLEALPGPNQAPLHLALTFPTGEVREFVFPVEPGALRRGWSSVGEALSAAAFGLTEGSTDVAQGQEGMVQVAFVAGE
jgi:hypothetical protein